MLFNRVMRSNKVRIGCPTEVDGAALYIAQEKGYFRDASLDVTLVPYGPGKSTIDTKNAWNLAMVDPMEMILGEQLGLKTIAISSDRSTTNQMVANRQGVNLWPLEKMDKNHPIVLPMDTSVEYAIRICMKTHGYKMEDVSLIDIPQDTCAAEMMGDNPKANFGGFQFPYMYDLLENYSGSEVICSAASAYERLVGGIVADSKFAESKPEIVKRALASWFRALKYMNDKRNKEEVLEYFRVFFLLRNVEISRPSLESHIQSTVMFDFDDQLGLMKREGKSPPKSLLDKWTEGIGDFVVSKGMRPSRPEPAKFITDEYLKQIQDDPNLYGFVQGNSPSDFGVIVPELAVYKSQHSSDGILPTGLFLAAAIVMAFMALVSQGFGLSIPYLRSWSRRRYFNQSEQEYSPLEQSSPGYIELLDSHEMS